MRWESSRVITESVYQTTRDVTELQIVEMVVMRSAPLWVSIRREGSGICYCLFVCCTDVIVTLF